MAMVITRRPQHVRMRSPRRVSGRQLYQAITQLLGGVCRNAHVKSGCARCHRALQYVMAKTRHRLHQQHTSAAPTCRRSTERILRAAVRSTVPHAPFVARLPTRVQALALLFAAGPSSPPPRRQAVHAAASLHGEAPQCRSARHEALRPMCWSCSSFWTVHRGAALRRSMTQQPCTGLSDQRGQQPARPRPTCLSMTCATTRE